MNLILLGLPGAGKGTQAQKLADKYGVPHVSMGDILRRNKDYETASGETVGEIIDAGNPVQVETLIELLSQRLDQPDCEGGFVLDGFPRTGEQAAHMDRLPDIDAIILLDVDEEHIYERLTKRRICPDCGAHYHLRYDPPADDGLCDACGADLVQREDDTRDAIKERIQWQQDGLDEVLDHFDADTVERVDANPSIDEVWEQVQAVADQYA